MAAKGDFLLVDYTLKDKDTGEVLDTTSREEAEKAGLRRDVMYKPKLVILGAGWLIKGLEEALEGMKEGEEKELEIPPEKAYGERDPSKVRIVAARELSRRGITPRVGTRVEIDGQFAIIRQVGSGRVILDFNHPLAGRTLLGKVKIVKVVKDTAEKIRELLHSRIPGVPKELFQITLLDGTAVIEIPEEARTLEGLPFVKRGVVRSIEQYIPEIYTVQFTETYVIKKPEPPKKKEEKKTEEKPAEEKKATRRAAKKKPSKE